jgi:hypothetical protein
MGDDEDYDFEYSDEEEEEEDVDIENAYYTSKSKSLLPCVFCSLVLVQFEFLCCCCFVFFVVVVVYSFFLNCAFLSGLAETNPVEALEGFEKVLKMETEPGEW